MVFLHVRKSEKATIERIGAGIRGRKGEEGALCVVLMRS
jgi:hypothetical protein